MSEYDDSPQALREQEESHNRCEKWAHDATAHAHEFVSPFQPSESGDSVVTVKHPRHYYPPPSGYVQPPMVYSPHPGPMPTTMARTIVGGGLQPQYPQYYDTYRHGRSQSVAPQGYGYLTNVPESQSTSKRHRSHSPSRHHSSHRHHRSKHHHHHRHHPSPRVSITTGTPTASPQTYVSGATSPQMMMQMTGRSPQISVNGGGEGYTYGSSPYEHPQHAQADGYISVQPQPQPQSQTYQIHYPETQTSTTSSLLHPLRTLSRLFKSKSRSSSRAKSVDYTYATTNGTLTTHYAVTVPASRSQSQHRGREYASEKQRSSSHHHRTDHDHGDHRRSRSRHRHRHRHRRDSSGSR